MHPHNDNVTILMADDDADDRFLTREAFEENQIPNHLQSFDDGVELMDYLHHRNKYARPESSPRPGLVLLDLNMPKKNGFQVLAEMQADPVLKNIRVVILSTSNNQEDINRTYELGAVSFITKPTTFDLLVDVVNSLNKYWLTLVELPRATRL